MGWQMGWLCYAGLIECSALQNCIQFIIVKGSSTHVSFLTMQCTVTVVVSVILCPLIFMLAEFLLFLPLAMTTNVVKDEAYVLWIFASNAITNLSLK